jgi:short-subunit dehydrogenase
MKFFKHGHENLPIGGFLLYYFYLVAIIIGTCQLLIFAYSASMFIYKHFFRKRHNLLQRYAEGKEGTAWAVVTGASDGIGAAYCEELAREGFNVALVSRTMSKLQSVEQLCKAANPRIKTRVVQADFSNASRAKESEIIAFYEDLRKKLEDLDIAILVNNAGLMTSGLFSDIQADSSKSKDIIDVNIMHLGMMNSMFQDRLLKRQRDSDGAIRSAIINVSSAVGYFHGAAGIAVYNASKGYVHSYSIA